MQAVAQLPNAAFTSFTFAQLGGALRQCGIDAGDTVFFHVGLENLGSTMCGGVEPELHAGLFSTLRDVLGPEGTLILPAYTFSLCRGETFDPDTTPAQAGPWQPSSDFAEFVRGLPSVVRSRDPIHSVVACGPSAPLIAGDVPPTCFGPDSPFDRLLKCGGKICMIGLPLEEATFRHAIEERVGAPFRFKKLFTGFVRERGERRKTGWLYSVRILAENGYPDARAIEAIPRDRGLARAAAVGSGEILVIDCAAYAHLLSTELRKDPWITAKGPAGNPAKFEDARVGARLPKVDLPPDASTREMVEKLWHLKRDIVSDGYDAALYALSGQLPMTIHEYPSGTECWSWIVPEKWTCHEAHLETMEGRRLFSYEDHPLHTMSYSLPFDGEVTRDELLRHLHVHPLLPDAVPFVFKYYERDWGLCCSRRLRDSLQDERYRVLIRTDFSCSTLKVGEVIARGASDDCVMLCAHLCHPGMVNDDLSGGVVGIEVMRRLLRRTGLRYTYRFTIVPETIGSVAYLSAHEHLVRRIKGGLFLEMLGLPNPHALQLSFRGDTEIDRCFSVAIHDLDPSAWTSAYRTVIGNDERQYNGPGVRVPMLSLSRVLPPSSPLWPYPEYHSSADNPSSVDFNALDQSVDAVIELIDTLESNRIPVNKYKGESFCSRYGLFIDEQKNPLGYKYLFEVMDQIDGTANIAEIAAARGIPFKSVLGITEELRRHGLIEYR